METDSGGSRTRTPDRTAGPLEPRQEWWQRLATRWAAWAERHQTLLRRLRLARAVWLWGCLAWLLVLAVARPELREGLKVFAQLYWLLVAWFLLSRTKTVSWRLVAGVFSAGIVWSLGVGWFLHGMAQAGRVQSLGAMVSLAGIGEESLKLAPLALLAIAAPGRVRRFAVTDWLLLGFASGLAFQAVEELARRTWAQVRGPVLDDVLHGVGERGPDTGFAQYGWSPLSGWQQWAPGTQFPGHHAMTALVAVTVGLAVVAWRRGGRAWRAAALTGPVVMWWVVVSVHGGGNATGRAGESWLEAENPSVPWVFRTGWEVANHGVGLRWLLPALLVVALLVDARVAGRPPVPAIARDVADLLAAHARQPGETRRRALARGRAAGAMLRAVRAEAMERAAGPPSRSGRLWGVAALGALLAATLWLAPRWADRIGNRPELRDVWLAGILDSLGTWWDGQSTGSKIAVAIGIAALIALSGGSLGLAFGVSGVGTYVLAHGHGAADFVRDPGAATRSYLATTTPAGMAADGAEALLTFGPWSFAGAAAGRGIRSAADEFADDPAAWLARRRAAARGDRGAIDLPGYGRVNPDDVIRLPNGGTVIPGRLEVHEVVQAIEIVEHRGGHFVGVPKRDTAGIDGHLDGEPVSLKNTDSQSLASVLTQASEAETSAENARFNDIDLYVRAPNLPGERLLDFARKGPLAEIPYQGVLRTIYVRVGDGWLTIPGDLA